jgi:hypothetical protein
MYQASVPAFLKMLNNLFVILDRAEAFAAEHKIEPEVLLIWRLAPDMFSFTRQIQIAADFARAPRRGLPARRCLNTPMMRKASRRSRPASPKR